MYAQNHGIARRGPRARIAYAGTRNPQTSPELEPVIPPPRTVATGTNTRPTLISRMTNASKSRVRESQIRLPALNSDSPIPKTQLSGCPPVWIGSVSGAKTVT